MQRYTETLIRRRCLNVKLATRISAGHSNVLRHDEFVALGLSISVCECNWVVWVLRKCKGPLLNDY